MGFKKINLKEVFFKWFSLSKIMELFIVASSIAIIFGGLVAIDFFSQESKVFLNLEGPVHGVVRSRFIRYYEEKKLSIPAQINLNKMLDVESFPADAFMKFIPIEGQEKVYRIEPLGKRVKPLTGFIEYLESPNLEYDTFVKSKKLNELLKNSSIQERNQIFSALISSTISAVKIYITNTGRAEAQNLTLKIMKPYIRGDPGFTRKSSMVDETEIIIAPGKLYKLEGIGISKELTDKESYEINIGNLKKGDKDFIKIYTIGGAISERNLSFTKFDKPRLNKTFAISIFLILELLILIPLIIIDIYKFIHFQEN